MFGSVRGYNLLWFGKGYWWLMITNRLGSLDIWKSILCNRCRGGIYCHFRKIIVGLVVKVGLDR